MEGKVSAKKGCKIVSDQRRRRRRRKGRVRDNFNCGNSRISVQKAKSLDSPFDSGKHLAPIDPNTRERTMAPVGTTMLVASLLSPSTGAAYNSIFELGTLVFREAGNSTMKSRNIRRGRDSYLLFPSIEKLSTNPTLLFPSRKF